jgi:hypothetical protein
MNTGLPSGPSTDASTTPKALLLLSVAVQVTVVARITGDGLHTTFNLVPDSTTTLASYVT